VKPAAVLVAAFALGGCWETEPQGAAPEPPAQTRPTSETEQAERGAIRALRSHCTGARWNVPNAPVPRARRSDAIHAVTLLLRHARRSGDEDNLAWREDLAALAGTLERLDCLPGQVPRIDRALRLLPLPVPEEPEYGYEPEPYEPYYP
jgi:hypothetical protein